MSHSRRRPITLRLLRIYIVLCVFLVNSVSVFAIDTGFLSNNNILFYNPSETQQTCYNSVFTGTFPAQTTERLSSLGLEEKLEETRARYEYAQQQTNVPWQALAAIHYREGGMNPTTSISNGQALGTGVNVDGLYIPEDANEDALQAANHFLSLANSVYGNDREDITFWTFEDWANAFLAYNRGSLYKQNGYTYTDSPYVMNGFDADHIDMNWVGGAADPGSSTTGGGRDTNLGALVIMTYFGATPGSSDGATLCGTSSVAGNIVATAILLSWPDRSNSVNDPKSEYVDAMEEVNLTNAGCGPNGADCGVFVATVMRVSGADTEFPIGTSNIIEYLRTNTGKYSRVSATDTSGLMPGDIFVIRAATSGHIMMYVGDSASDDGKSNASASCSERIGDRGVDIYFSDSRGTYEIYRKIQEGQS